MDYEAIVDEFVVYQRDCGVHPDLLAERAADLVFFGLHLQHHYPEPVLLPNLTRSVVNGFANWMKFTLGYSKSSRESICSSVKVFCEYLLGQGILTENVAEDLRCNHLYLVPAIEFDTQ